jgi:hypothetical protein
MSTNRLTKAWNFLHPPERRGVIKSIVNIYIEQQTYNGEKCGHFIRIEDSNGILHGACIDYTDPKLKVGQEVNFKESRTRCTIAKVPGLSDYSNKKDFTYLERALEPTKPKKSTIPTTIEGKIIESTPMLSMSNPNYPIDGIYHAVILTDKTTHEVRYVAQMQLPKGIRIKANIDKERARGRNPINRQPIYEITDIQITHKPETLCCGGVIEPLRGPGEEFLDRQFG